MSYQVLHGVIMAAHRVSKVMPDQIYSKDRARKIGRVRQAAMYVIRQRTDWSLPLMGRHFGGRDHTTVHHAIKLIEGMLGDPEIDRLVSAMMRAPEVSMAQYDAWLAGLRGEQVAKPKPPMLKPVARGLPAPERSEIPGPKWFSSLDEDGQSYSERYMQFDMQRGSESLRDAILMARAA